MAMYIEWLNCLVTGGLIRQTGLMTPTALSVHRTYMVADCANWCKRLQTGANLFKLVQIGVNWCKLVQTSAN